MSRDANLSEDSPENETCLLDNYRDVIDCSDLEKLKDLIQKNADKDRVALIKAMLYADSKENYDCLRALLENEHDRTARDRYGCNPLMISALCGCDLLVPYLLHKIPDGEVKELAEEAMPYAAHQKHFDILKLLFAKAYGTPYIFQDVACRLFLERIVNSSPRSVIRYLKEKVIKDDVNIEKERTKLVMKFIVSTFAIFDHTDHIFCVKELVSNIKFNGVDNYDQFRCHLIGLDHRLMHKVVSEYIDPCSSESF